MKLPNVYFSIHNIFFPLLRLKIIYLSISADTDSFPEAQFIVLQILLTNVFLWNQGSNDKEFLFFLTLRSKACESFIHVWLCNLHYQSPYIVEAKRLEQVFISRWSLLTDGSIRWSVTVMWPLHFTPVSFFETVCLRHGARSGGVRRGGFQRPLCDVASSL